MKKSSILLIIATILFSCGAPEKKIDGAEWHEQGSTVIVEIDGCEYIKSSVHSGFNYCHKGNCKNHKK